MRIVIRADSMRIRIIMSAWRQNDDTDPQRTFLRRIVAWWRGKIPRA